MIVKGLKLGPKHSKLSKDWENLKAGKHAKVYTNANQTNKQCFITCQMGEYFEVLGL